MTLQENRFRTSQPCGTGRVDGPHRPPVAEPLLTAVLVEDLSLARTLPAEAYISAEVHAWEQANLFDGGWVAIGRTDLVPVAGDHTAVRVGTKGVLLSRTRDGQLHGFLNACPHRGHELLAENVTANKSGIRCPYHSWVFGLDGQLLSATHFDGGEGFRTADWPLQQVKVAEWLGWIFVNVSGTAPEFSEFIGDLDEILAPWLRADLVHVSTKEYVEQTNWKLITENYLECYHCPSIHPELCKVADTDQFVGYDPVPRYWVGGGMALAPDADTMSLSGRSGTHLVPGLRLEDLRQVHYIALPTNLLISAHPDYVMFHRLVSRAADEVYVECSWYFPRAATETAGFDPSSAVDFWDTTNIQDFRATESVTRGMTSGGFRPGVFDSREGGVRGFQAVIADFYLTGRWHPAMASDFAATP
jgi:glycine betaine catabolism A